MSIIHTCVQDSTLRLKRILWGVVSNAVTVQTNKRSTYLLAFLYIWNSRCTRTFFSSMLCHNWSFIYQRYILHFFSLCEKHHIWLILDRNKLLKIQTLERFKFYKHKSYSSSVINSFSRKLCLLVICSYY